MSSRSILRRLARAPRANTQGVRRRLARSAAMLVVGASTAIMTPSAGAVAPNYLPNVSLSDPCGTFTGVVQWSGLSATPSIHVTKGSLRDKCSRPLILLLSYTNGPLFGLLHSTLQIGQTKTLIKNFSYSVGDYLYGYGNIKFALVTRFANGGSTTTGWVPVTKLPAPAPAPVAAPAPPASAPPATQPVVVSKPVIVPAPYKPESPSGSCTAAGGSDYVTAVASATKLGSSSVQWVNIALKASPGAYYRVDLLSPGGVEITDWRGPSLANDHPFTFAPSPTAAVGSKLYVTAFFPDGQHCGATATSS